MLPRSLLCSVEGSALEAMFSGRHELRIIDGKVYVQRDPKIFRLLISYLRNCQRLPEIEDKLERELFDLELDFW